MTSATAGPEAGGAAGPWRRWRPWQAAMQQALYGPEGFYRSEPGPAAHFRTSVHASPRFGAALLSLAGEVDELLGGPDGFTLVDVGAGRGELLTQWAARAPERWRLVGVDVVARPVGLPARVEWLAGLDRLEPMAYAVVVANEWLDNVPLEVVQDDRLVEVAPDGRERAVATPCRDDVAWCERWAPGRRRVEVGRTRDEAWAGLLALLDQGLAVTADYAADFVRPGHGTLTGYRAGRQVPPVPDASCDLTAHVLLASCAAAAGGPALVCRQRDALHALGVSTALPPRELASLDPAGYLEALTAAGGAGELTDPAGLGGHGWLVQPRGIAFPRSLRRLAGADG